METLRPPPFRTMAEGTFLARSVFPPCVAQGHDGGPLRPWFPGPAPVGGGNRRSQDLFRGYFASTQDIAHHPFVAVSPPALRDQGSQDCPPVRAPFPGSDFGGEGKERGNQGDDVMIQVDGVQGKTGSRGRNRTHAAQVGKGCDCEVSRPANRLSPLAALSRRFTGCPEGLVQRTGRGTVEPDGPGREDRGR